MTIRLTNHAIILVFIFALAASAAEKKADEMLPAVGEAAEGTGPIIYQGNAVSKAWVSAKYQRYRDKVLYIDKKLVSLSRADVRKKSGEIQAVLTDGTCLLEEPGAAGATESRAGRRKEIPLIRISGLPPREAVPGKSILDLRVIKKGIYTYTARGDVKTVDSYRTISPITRRDFERALRAGQKLPRITIKDRKLARELAPDISVPKKDREKELSLIRPVKREPPTTDASPEEGPRYGLARKRKPTFMLRGRASPLANGEATKRTKYLSVLVGRNVSGKANSGKACYRFDYAERQTARALILLIKSCNLSETKGVRLYIKTDAPQNEIHITFREHGRKTSPDIPLARYTAEGAVSVDWTRVDIPLAAITRTGWKADNAALIMIGYQRGVRKSPCTIWVDDIDAILP